MDTSSPLCSALYSYTIHLKGHCKFQKQGPEEFRAHTHSHSFPRPLRKVSGWGDTPEGKGWTECPVPYPELLSPLNVCRGMSGPAALSAESESKGDLCPTLHSPWKRHIS